MDDNDLGLMGLYVATNFVAPPLLHDVAQRLKANGYEQLGGELDVWGVPLLNMAFFYRSIRQQRHITEKRVMRALTTTDADPHAPRAPHDADADPRPFAAPRRKGGVKEGAFSVIDSSRFDAVRPDDEVEGAVLGAKRAT